jgi:hypothetical protein
MTQPELTDALDAVEALDAAGVEILVDAIERMRAIGCSDASIEGF